MKHAVVLLSGGIDSATCLALAKQQGFEPCALSFRYAGQHRAELEAATRLVQAMGVNRHLVLELPLEQILDSVRDSRERPFSGAYLPARSSVFLSMALGWAEVLGAQDIFIGFNDSDAFEYSDCRPEFLAAFENMANLATAESIQGDFHISIQAPLLEWTKAQIIRKGRQLGVDYGLTHSCRQPTQEGWACGECASCRRRRQGFREAEIEDPVRYVVG